MNVRISRYLFQVVWWGWRWNVGYWRWPPADVRQEIDKATPGRGATFGFHGVYIGPVEFRFHPDNRTAT
jgi:hypothetical protein